MIESTQIQRNKLSHGSKEQHPQTQKTICVYHGTHCLTVADGEIICRIFGNVINRVEDTGIYGTELNSSTSEHFNHSNAREFLGTVDPVLNTRSNKLHMKREIDAIWYQRIRNVADQFNLKKSLRDEIEFVFSLLRRKTSHRPSLILFFAFYNTCRDHGSAAINEVDLRNTICHCCNLKSMYTILKIYGIFAIDAQKLGIYKNNTKSGFYFNAFLRTASKLLELDEIDRNFLERDARKRYQLLPPSMTEKARTKSAFQSTLGTKIYESVRGQVKY